jgi:hypothetical protein
LKNRYFYDQSIWKEKNSVGQGVPEKLYYFPYYVLLWTSPHNILYFSFLYFHIRQNLLPCVRLSLQKQKRSVFFHVLNMKADFLSFCLFF